MYAFFHDIAAFACVLIKEHADLRTILLFAENEQINREKIDEIRKALR